MELSRYVRSIIPFRRRAFILPHNLASLFVDNPTVIKRYGFRSGLTEIGYLIVFKCIVSFGLWRSSTTLVDNPIVTRNRGKSAFSVTIVNAISEDFLFLKTVDCGDSFGVRPYGLRDSRHIHYAIVRLDGRHGSGISFCTAKNLGLTT